MFLKAGILLLCFLSAPLLASSSDLFVRPPRNEILEAAAKKIGFENMSNILGMSPVRLQAIIDSGHPKTFSANMRVEIRNKLAPYGLSLEELFQNESYCAKKLRQAADRAQQKEARELAESRASYEPNRALEALTERVGVSAVCEIFQMNEDRIRTLIETGATPKFSPLQSRRIQKRLTPLKTQLDDLFKASNIEMPIPEPLKVAAIDTSVEASREKSHRPVSAEELRELMDRALAKDPNVLRAREKSYLDLRYFSDLSVTEIAKTFKTDPTAIKTVIDSALAKLRAATQK